MDMSAPKNPQQRDTLCGATFERVADFTLGEAVAIPDKTLRFAALLMTDTIGIAAGSAKMEPGILARDYAVDFMAAANERHQARLMFDGRKASPVGAAFALASQIDNLDGHDGYNPTKGHIGCAVVPSLIALSQNLPNLTAGEALKAMVIGYEVATRAAIALHATVSDYHTSGAWNGLGVAAMACRLLGADRGQLREALGIAEYHGPRSQMMREIDNPTMLHDGSGMGALVGIKAAVLAMRGFTGAPAITVEGDLVASIWNDLGSKWTVDLNYIKPYPICRWAHAPIDAVGKLMLEEEFELEDVESVVVSTFHESSRLYAQMPDTTSKAQYSLAFAVATMLRKGHIGVDEISGQALGDAETARVMQLVIVREDERHSARFPQGRWADVAIVLKDGRKLVSGDVHARGGPEEPMTMDEIEAKFHLMAGKAVDEKNAGKIWDRGLGLSRNLQQRFSDFSALLY